MNGSILSAISLVMLTLAVAPGTAASSRADFYVSPGGSDRWTGKLPAPTPSGTDGPFATVARAQAAVRAFRASQPDIARPVVVMLRGGIYYLPQTLSFGPEDSGTRRSPNVYMGYPGESAIISGGVPVKAWTRGTNGAWRTTLPEVTERNWRFSQLFVNGQRRYRPRLPADGYFHIARDLPPTDANAAKGFDRFGFTPGEIRSGFHNLSDIDILCFQTWTMARMKIASLDESSSTVNLTGTTRGTPWYAKLASGNRYIVENVREAQRRPGQWYLDSTSGELTYLPLPGERFDNTLVIAPRLDRLVQFAGDLPGKQWVQWFTLRGITFAHTNWNTPPEGYTSPQAEAGLRGAITADGIRHCSIENCSIRHTGEYALDFGDACKHNSVTGGSFLDLGAGGVKLGSAGRNDDDERVSSHNIVSGCVIAHAGRMHPAGIGIWIGQSHHNRISRNEIADLYYTGVSVGWTWGYGPSQAHHNTVELNHIHDIGQGVLSDMGGIYTLGVSPGSLLRRNRIHDISSFAYGGWGIYFDEGTTGMVARDNVVFRTKSAGFHQHYGRDNLVENNIFAFGRDAQIMRTRAEEHLSFTFRRNIVLWKDAPLLGSNWQGDNYVFDNNTYWDLSGKQPAFAGSTFDQWQARGKDQHSVIADPCLTDPGRDDYRLQPSSPALGLGFVPFDQSTSGPSKAIRLPSLAPPAFPVHPGPAPPRPIAEDFENTPEGARASDARTNEENELAVIRVSAERALSGNRSLKFTDAPGQQHNYSPHLYWEPGFVSGVLEARFAILLETPVQAYHEWRTAGTPYRVGPSIWIHEDARLEANTRHLRTLPLGKWIRFRIVCGVGTEATGTYDLDVTVEGEPVRRWNSVKCDPEFRGLDWFGFTSNSELHSVFYLDDVSLKLRG